METRVTKYSMYFDTLSEGDVFSPKEHTDRLFMKIESATIEGNGAEIMNAVSLTDGMLISVDEDDEVLFYCNARIAL